MWAYKFHGAMKDKRWKQAMGINEIDLPKR